jgi:hypothetical protein
VPDPADPGKDVTVVEHQPQIHAHRHSPANTLDDADDVRRLPARRHEIDEPHGAVAGVELGL